MRIAAWWIILLALSNGSVSAAVPSGFTDTLVAAVPAPTAIAFTPDGRILVASQTGALRVVSGGALLPTAAITFNSGTNGNICTNSERGLLGVAVHPEFTSNHHIYLYYTHKQNNSCSWSVGSPNAENRVSRFVLGDNNIVDPATETVIVDHIPSVAGNHNGGDLDFGADGLLYITVGDGGCSFDFSGCAGSNGNARFLNNLVGKILRLNDDGSIPSTNPRVGEAQAQRCGDPSVQPQPSLGSGACVEMFAWGLRNPFRFSFKKGTNTFYINDVGQGIWEEIDRGLINADYGWNVREGHCANGSSTNCGTQPAGMTNPIFDYSHASGCASITGGAFVTAGAWPSSYDNDYLFADFGCGRIFALDETGPTAVSSDFATSLGSSSVVALRFGDDGALYYTTYGGGGQLRRIHYTGTSNRTPVAGLTASPLSGSSPLLVTLDGSSSDDADGDALTFLWTFGDGATAETSTATTQHTYASGSWSASLRVRDPSGALSDPVSVTIEVDNAPPQVSITSPLPWQRFSVGETITLSGSATDLEDGALPDSALQWTLLLHHNAHTHPFLSVSGNNLTFAAPAPEDLDAVRFSYLEVRLAATDSANATTEVMQTFAPRVVNLVFRTVPRGLRLTLNGQEIQTPRPVPSWAGYNIAVGAPPQQDVHGQNATFVSWSDGGAASHIIVTPQTDATRTATFSLPTSITSITPESGSSSGGSVALQGTNFQSGAQLLFGNAAATAVSAPSPTSASATRPALTPGLTYDVRWTNTDSTAFTSPAAFFADFSDATSGHIFRSFIERLARSGATAGCGGGKFCPDAVITRGQMAVLLLRARYGSSFVPPPATGTLFSDVPASNLFAPWIERLAADGITAGCGGGRFCPDDSVTRSQMAVFLLTANDGTHYLPPPATGSFIDVPANDPFARWIEEFAARGVTAGCGGGRYCPSSPATRGHAAVFMSLVFDLE